jgi:hypothetical protein
MLTGRRARNGTGVLSARMGSPVRGVVRCGNDRTTDLPARAPGGDWVVLGVPPDGPLVWGN